MVGYGQLKQDEIVSSIPENTRANPPEHAETTVRQQFESRIRAAYVRAMRRWINTTNSCTNSTWGSKHKPELDGGMASNGRRYTSAWSAIATFLVNSNCLDVESFISANCMSGARPPNPHSLHTKDAMDVYCNHARLAPMQLSSALANQAGTFTVETTKLKQWYPDEPDSELWRRVLLTLDIQLSPLFCYCVAAKEGIPEVCQQFEELAISQYMTQPTAYKSTWSSVLPDALVQYCDALLATISRGE